MTPGRQVHSTVYDNAMPKSPHTCVIIHGKDGSPDMPWIRWLEGGLTDRGVRCIAPPFPPEESSTIDSWFSVLAAVQADPRETVYVAQARGAMALLRWIDSLPKTVRIPQIILIACNTDYQPHRRNSGGFYETPLNYRGLQEKCRSIVFIHSHDDPFVPVERAERLAAKLQAKFVQYADAGHFGNSKLDAPEVLRELDLASHLETPQT